MEPAQKLAVIATGIIFLTALLTGIWKWRQMLTSANHLAAPYVDIAHRSALMYSFAGLLVWHFAGWSVWPNTVDLIASAALFAFFIIAIATYIGLGFKNDTDNQFSERTASTTAGMVALIIAELGGFVVLFTGTLKGLSL